MVRDTTRRVQGFKKKREDKGIESQHNIWIRNDLWINLKELEHKERPRELGKMVNEALFDFLLRHKMSKEAGHDVDLWATYFDPRTNETRFKIPGKDDDKI